MNCDLRVLTNDAIIWRQYCLALCYYYLAIYHTVNVCMLLSGNISKCVHE